MMDKPTILDFIRKHDICVLSTVNARSEPQSAVVGFSINDRFELTIGSSSNSRKFQNIQHTPKVSVVIGWDDGITVQYEGVANVPSGDELLRYQNEHFARVPDAEKYKDDPSERYIVVKPKWLRYTDCNTEPWEVKELNF